MSNIAMTKSVPPSEGTRSMTREQKKIIFASSLGTVFEWYDFYIYGTLGVFLAKYFFSNVPPNVGFIFALLAFAAGFAVRPFGALIFGRLGDVLGQFGVGTARDQFETPSRDELHGPNATVPEPAAYSARYCSRATTL